MKIAFFEVKEWECSYIRPHFPDFHLYFSGERLDEHHLPHSGISTAFPCSSTPTSMPGCWQSFLK